MGNHLLRNKHSEYLLYCRFEYPGSEGTAAVPDSSVPLQTAIDSGHTLTGPVPVSIRTAPCQAGCNSPRRSRYRYQRSQCSIHSTYSYNSVDTHQSTLWQSTGTEELFHKNPPQTLPSHRRQDQGTSQTRSDVLHETSSYLLSEGLLMINPHSDKTSPIYRNIPPTAHRSAGTTE